jgi:hypothetical protein
MDGNNVNNVNEIFYRYTNNNRKMYLGQFQELTASIVGDNTNDSRELLDLFFGVFGARKSINNNDFFEILRLFNYRHGENNNIYMRINDIIINNYNVMHDDDDYNDDYNDDYDKNDNDENDNDENDNDENDNDDYNDDYDNDDDNYDDSDDDTGDSDNDGNTKK